MKDCVVKDWRVLCLLLLCTAVYYTTSQCTSGNITVTIDINIDQPNMKAGRISICDGGEWKAICHHDWDLKDARVACRQLGFPAEGAQSCNSSCFGIDTRYKGLTDFTCNGNESSLLQCSPTAASGNRARNDGTCRNSQVAGVLCIRTSPATTNVPLTCPTSLKSPRIDKSAPPNVTANVNANAVASTECAATGGGGAIGASLGAVFTLLLLTLVGVVTGWVWSCHRNKGKVKIRDHVGNFDNPTYSPVTPTVPYIQYSSLGPRDTPTTGHTPPLEGEVEGGEGMYHIMGEGEGQVEGEGMVYEVPIQTQSQEQRDESAGRAVEMAYSTLHHN